MEKSHCDFGAAEVIRASLLMKTLCVIGNSHIGAIKSGWDQIKAQDKNVSMHFFGSKSQSLSRTFVEDGILKTNDEQIQRSLERTGGSAEIDLRNYDGFVIVGGGLHLKKLARLLKFGALYPHKKSDQRLVSQGLLVEAFKTYIRTLAVWKLLRLLSGARGDVPVYVIPEPFFSKSVMKTETKDFINFAHDSGAGKALAEAFDKSCTSVVSDFGGFIEQPHETREDFIFTADRYSLGPVSMRRMMDMDREARDDDHAHKNADYGELVMRSFLMMAF